VAEPVQALEIPSGIEPGPAEDAPADPAPAEAVDAKEESLILAPSRETEEA
jgi:hypothetical protein